MHTTTLTNGPAVRNAFNTCYNTCKKNIYCEGKARYGTYESPGFVPRQAALRQVGICHCKPKPL